MYPLYYFVQVNSNGVISLGNEGFIDFYARPFPFDSPPLIAPFWDDFDPRNGGNIYYRQTNDSDQLQMFHNNYTLFWKTDWQNNFYPTNLFIATWCQVPPYGCAHSDTRKVNIIHVYEFVLIIICCKPTNQKQKVNNTLQVLLATNGNTNISSISLLQNSVGAESTNRL